jgi:hypothetical protein
MPGNMIYLAIVTPVNKTKRIMLRKKMVKVTTLTAGLPFPYGNAWTKADVAPVPIITVCQAKVKCLFHHSRGCNRTVVEAHRMHSFHDVCGDVTCITTRSRMDMKMD